VAYPPELDHNQVEALTRAGFTRRPDGLLVLPGAPLPPPLYTEPNQRGHGVGKGAFAETEGQLRNAGCQTMYWHASPFGKGPVMTQAELEDWYRRRGGEKFEAEGGEHNEFRKPLRRTGNSTSKPTISHIPLASSQPFGLPGPSANCSPNSGTRY
jgi:GNAT superfamily N-acetyltransferase